MIDVLEKVSLLLLSKQETVSSEFELNQYKGDIELDSILGMSPKAQLGPHSWSTGMFVFMCISF